MTGGITNGQIQPCKYCKKVQVTWDYRIKNVEKADGSFYKGYWREIDAQGQPNGQVHTFERCKGIQDGTIRVEEFKNLESVSKTELPLQSLQNNKKPENVGVKTLNPDLKKCLDFEVELFDLSKEISKTRQGFTLETINSTADRLLEIYKLNVEREQHLISLKLFQDISISLQKLGKQ